MLHVDSDFMQVLGLVFSSAWRIFKSFNIPGTNINPLELSLACLVILLVMRYVLPVVGYSPPNGNTSNSDNGGNGGNVSSSNRGNV